MENTDHKESNVMVVDDTPENLRLLVGMLNRQGYKVRPVPSGKLAFAAIEASPPDLILLDINMPEMNGYDVCRKLKSQEHTKEIPVIFISAMDETIDKVKAFSVGGVDYITKPFQMEEVLARMHTHLKLNHLQRELQEINKDLEQRVKERTAEVLRLEKYEADVRIGKEVQESILPQTFPPFPDRSEIDIFANMHPAREVGGDFYDFFFVDQSNLFFAIGDVSGKGVPAALFMAIVKTLLKNKAMAGFSPQEVLFQVNNSIMPDNVKCMFATVFCGILDTETGKITYCNAGHNPPLLYKNGSFDYLHIASGVAVGAMPVDISVFKQTEITLQPGEIIFLYSDGITEAVNKNQDFFSEEKLKSSLNEISNVNAEQIVKGICEKIEKFAEGAEQSDDITILTIKYAGK